MFPARPFRSIVLLALALVTCGVAATAGPRHKKLIEFGWDEPNTAFLRASAAEMERTPFDGTVFHIDYAKPDGTAGRFTWEVWGTKTFTIRELQPALDDLKATRFKRLKHNFLRFNVTPGNVDWFDDYSAILENARLAGRIAREGKCVGIMFDIEQYDAPLFTYRKQRDAGTKSWEAYADQAHRRGRELMRAFQRGYPGLTLFLTYGYCLPWVQCEGRLDHLPEANYGLLAPFVDGLLDGAKGGSRIIDGYELSFGYKDPAKFRAARRMMTKTVLPMVANPARYKKYYSLSFAVWMDHEWRTNGWHADDVRKNYFTPDTFSRSVHAALQTADEYVWIYTETPRWWSGDGSTVKLPGAYDAALRRAVGIDSVPGTLPR